LNVSIKIEFAYLYSWVSCNQRGNKHMINFCWGLAVHYGVVEEQRTVTDSDNNKKGKGGKIE